MNDKRLISFLEFYASPVLLSLAGLILLIRPDSATRLLSDIIAWGMILVGAVLILGILLTQNFLYIFRWLQAAGCIGMGVFFIAHPLLMSQLLSQVLGLLVLAQGISSISRAYTPLAKVLAVLTLLAAAVLIFAPLTLSRVVLRIIAVVMICVGGAELIDRIYLRKRLHDRDDPNVIDAD